MKTALLIGNSSGIGSQVTKKLLDQNYHVIGISKSESSIVHLNYRHIIKDVCDDNYRVTLEEVLSSIPELNLCIYFAGIGDLLDWNNLNKETKVFNVNLMSAVITTELALIKMQKQNFGHFIGLSSAADVLISSQAPSYSASKAGVSKFWEGLGLAMKNKNIKISNIRFGFVDTKMSKASVRPFLLSADEAAEYLLKIIKKPKIRATKPKLIIPLVWLSGLSNRIQLLFK